MCLILHPIGITIDRKWHWNGKSHWLKKVTERRMYKLRLFSVIPCTEQFYPYAGLKVFGLLTDVVRRWKLAPIP